MVTGLRAAQYSPGQDQSRAVTCEELLGVYLRLSYEQREEQFAPTARVAEITGLSQRTIELWIDIGALLAVRIGKKYQVSLASLREHLLSQLEK